MPTRIWVSFFRTDRALRGAHLSLLVPAFDFLSKHALLATFPVSLGISERCWGRPVALIRMVAAMVIVLSTATHDRIERVHESVYAVAALSILNWERLIACPQVISSSLCLLILPCGEIQFLTSVLCTHWYALLQLGTQVDLLFATLDE